MSMPEIEIRAAFVPAECRCDEDDWRSKADKFIVTLECDGKQFRCEYWQGSGHGGKQPVAEDVFDCLRCDAESGALSHAEYCDGLGEDRDSIATREMWWQCVAQYEKLRKWLGKHFAEFMKGGNE